MKWVKTAIRNVLNRGGYDVIRHLDMASDPIPLLPFIVAERVKTSRPFFFVQIGANDGMVGDPLRPLILRYALRGLLIEPQPDVFARLKANYAQHQGLLFEQCAIAEEDGHRALYSVRSDSKTKDRSVLASFRKKVVVAHPGVTERCLEEVTVRTTSMKSLVKRYELSDLALLQIDVEGYDYQIVKMAFEAGLRPDIVNLEFVHLPPREKQDCCNLLRANGYQYIEYGMDMVAVRRKWSADVPGCVFHA